MKRILFVCLGNICRSPTAEAVLRVRAPGWHVDSAGTSDWHIGDPPYQPMRRVAADAGFPMDDLRARQFTALDFDHFDLILGMDAKNLAGIEALRPPSTNARTGLLTDYLEAAVSHVPDPYYTRDFAGALRLIERCIDALVAKETA